LLAATLAPLCAERAAAEDQYGVIAYDKRKLIIINECRTQEGCEAQALESCRKDAPDPDACKVLIWFRNNCGAFASASNDSYGAGWAPTVEEAGQIALQKCSEYGGQDCALRAHACSYGNVWVAPGPW
jgi:hypothetical protein